MTDQTVALTIIEQLGGYGKLKTMVNARNLSCTSTSLTFKFRGCSKANCMKIELNHWDTYDVTFYKIQKCDFKIVRESDGIYCDMLIDIFESFTGLYLSLGSVKMVFNL